MIGIFDSGIGGLTVLKEIIKTLPQYNYIYLADTARAPYGGHSQATVTRFTQQAVNWLFNQGCPLVILACHTASSQALRELQQRWLPTQNNNKRILGVVRPLAEAAAVSNGRVGVLATRATVESQAFIHEITKLNPKLEVIQQMAPLLVPLIEEGWLKDSVTKKILKVYLRPLKDFNIKTLILGCTHYPHLLPMIKPIMGPRINIIEAGPVVAAKLTDYLHRHPEIEQQLIKDGSVRFITTDDPQRFAKQSQGWWNKPIKAEQIKLD